jgi:hypothetical protein
VNGQPILPGFETSYGFLCGRAKVQRIHIPVHDKTLGVAPREHTRAGKATGQEGQSRMLDAVMLAHGLHP